MLVGASTGGLIAREYASRYPAEVSGLVLVDGISEAVQGLMKPGQFARYNQHYLQSPSPAASRYTDLEAIDFYRSFAEIGRKRRPPRLHPVAVLSNDSASGPPGVSRRFARLREPRLEAGAALPGLAGPADQAGDRPGERPPDRVNRPGLVEPLRAADWWRGRAVR